MKYIELNKVISHQFLRFLITGGVGFVLYYVLALGLRWWFELPHAAAGSLANVMAIPPVFFLQRSFTFRSQGSASHQLVGYSILQIVAACLVGFVAFLAARCGLDDLVAFFLAGVAGALFSYGVQKSLIFSNRNA